MRRQEAYPVGLTVDYPDRPLDKVLRYILVSLISIAVSQLEVRQHAASLGVGPLRG